MDFLPGLISGLAIALTAFPLKALAKKGNTLVLGFYVEFIGLLFFLPFFNLNLIIANFSWNALFAGLIWIFYALVFYYSYEDVDASTRIIFIGIQPVLAALSASIFLGESFTMHLLLSLLLSVVACVVLYYSTNKRIITKKGFLLAFATCIFAALGASFDKLVSGDFGIYTYMSYAYIFTCLGLALAILFSGMSFKINVKKTFWSVFLAAIGSSIVFVLLIKSYYAVGVGFTNLLILTSIPWTIMLGYFFAKEKDHLKEKILASLIIVATVVLLSV